MKLLDDQEEDNSIMYRSSEWKKGECSLDSVQLMVNIWPFVA
jgi:hypothetical protein